MSGSFCLVLHSHIPYCRKSGVWPAGEEWLFEAMNECYIPLLIALRRLVLEGIRPGITVGVVPILAEQLSDGYMKARFLEYMGDKIVRAQHDMERFKDDPARRRVAEYWVSVFEGNVRAYVKDFHQDILGTLKWLQDERRRRGDHVRRDARVPAAAWSATAPCTRRSRSGWRPTSGTSGKGRAASGCPSARTGPPKMTGENGGAGSTSGSPISGSSGSSSRAPGSNRPPLSKIRPDCGAPTTDRGYRLGSGVGVFGRNGATGRQVWSAAVGYPSHPEYLEFHWQDPETGLRYHRVTGKETKEIYDPEKAARRVRKDAAHFVRLLSAEVKRAAAAGVASPVIVSPYDTELFGHWWHEGPAFIEEVARALAKKRDVTPARLGDYDDANRDGFPTIEMGRTSWGENGDFTVWQNPEHGWIWPLINDCCRHMEEVLGGIEKAGYVPDGRGVRILKQMARELLLMQGSDWPFLLYTEQAREYANKRFHTTTSGS